MIEPTNGSHDSAQDEKQSRRSTKRKRHLRAASQVAPCDAPLVRRMLPFS